MFHISGLPVVIKTVILMLPPLRHPEVSDRELRPGPSNATTRCPAVESHTMTVHLTVKGFVKTEQDGCCRRRLLDARAAEAAGVTFPWSTPPTV